LGLWESAADFLLVIAIAQIVTTIIAVDIVMSIVLLNSGTVGLGAVVPVGDGLEESENTDSPVEEDPITSPLPEA
jgi:hypothetical protein